MGSLSGLIRALVALAAIGAGAAALWRRKDQVREMWDSLGGVDGVMDSATKLADTMGPVKDFVTQVSRFKR